MTVTARRRDGLPNWIVPIAVWPADFGVAKAQRDPRRRGEGMARDEETARYREAAQLALDQLDWCVEYLRSIRKPRIAKQLARNHAAISRRLHHSAGHPDSRARP